jgi:uncharacterized integral membrane protein (TIGR00698 family)
MTTFQLPLNLAVRKLVPGLLASSIVAIAAMSLAQHYGAPVMLFALLLGMSMNFLGTESTSKAGIEFASRTVLRIGVALLGLRITWSQVAQLGWQPVFLVVGAVVVTILVGVVVARAFGFSSNFGLLTGGSVGICGASAALALSAALPNHEMKERATLFTVISVSALSTLAMVIYPLIVHGAGMDSQAAGIFLGGTIHDVAQVVGAGYSMSQKTGDTATIVKLLRVAMLLPVILVAAMITRVQAGKTGDVRPPMLPWFAVVFAVLVAVNSLGWIPDMVRIGGQQASQWCLVVAIASIGMKTQLKELSTVGWRPVALMLLETVFLAAVVFGMLRYSGMATHG